MGRSLPFGREGREGKEGGGVAARHLVAVEAYPGFAGSGAVWAKGEFIVAASRYL